MKILNSGSMLSVVLKLSLVITVVMCSTDNMKKKKKQDNYHFFDVNTGESSVYNFNYATTKNGALEKAKIVASTAATTNTNRPRVTNVLVPRLAAQQNSTEVKGADYINESKGSHSNLVTAAASEVKLVKVDSKSGQLIARMQGKRQADGSNAPSRRNEDPWFLDQAPYPLQPYRFAYNVKGKNGQTEQYRQEVGDGKFLSGSYGYVLPDGIYRHVDYVADDRGFRAFIRTSEPGTANQNPANVVIASNPVIGGTSGVSYAEPELTLPPQSLLSSQQYQPAIDYSTLKSTEASDGSQLIRRPPGSIVNNALRNFTSFAYTTPAPTLISATPPAPSFGPFFRDEPSNLVQGNTSSTLSSHIRGRHNWAQSKPEQEELFSKIKPLPQLEPWEQRANQFTGLNYNRLGYLGAASFDSQPQTRQQQQQQVQSSTTQGPFGSLQQRFGSRSSNLNKLAYDRPLSFQGDRFGTNKLTYDQNHVLHPDLPYLSFERARGLAQLNQLNSAGFRGLHYIRPLVANDAVNLTPVQGSGDFSSSHDRHEEHHRESQHENHSHHQQQDGANKPFVSKEHHEGSKSVSGREFEFHRSTNQLSPSLPHQPQHLFQPQVTESPLGSTKGGGRLQAPYTSSHPQEQQHQVKGSISQVSEQAQEPKRFDEQYAFGQKSLDSSEGPLAAPTSPTPPSPPSKVSVDETNTGSRQESQGISSPELTELPRTTQTQSDKLQHGQHLDQQKSASGTKGAGGSGLSRPLNTMRSVRGMPEDFRTDMVMNDLRSMQNTLGLPQPPRLQRASSLGSNLADPDPLVSAKIRRLETLLSSSPGIQGGSPNQPNQSVGQASVQRAVAVSALSAANELERPTSTTMKSHERRLRGGIDSINKIGLLSGELNNDLIAEGLASSINETFDARRLSTAAESKAAARFQAEKVSELQKFQQRLRTQQLLLEHTKNPEKLSAANRSTTIGHTELHGVKPRLGEHSHQSAEVNSHVRYDEEAETETPGIQPQVQHVFNSRESSNNEQSKLIRRQTTTLNRTTSSRGPEPENELNTDEQPPRRKLTIVQHSLTRANGSISSSGQPKQVSDFARQIQLWPSLLQSGENNNSNKTLEFKTVKSDHGIHSLAVANRSPPKDHQLLIEKSVSRFRDASLDDFMSGRNNSNGATQVTTKPTNTINLDFINSVTALSVDHLNPFAIASVNPAVQRSSALGHRTNEGRLLSLDSDTSSNLGSSPPLPSIATTSARYFNSPELLAALNYHERRDTSGQLKSMLSGGGLSGSVIDTTTGQKPAGSWPSNHQLGGVTSAAAASYSIVGAKLSSGMSEAANSQHKSFATMPARGSEEPTQVHHNTSQKQVGTKDHGKQQQLSGALSRDGFEIRDRAIKVDNQRFYEVVSSLSQPNDESSSFRAFRAVDSGASKSPLNNR